MMVKAWKDEVIIPTYEIGTPEKCPIFLEKRVYQGSSGEVYPHPVVEKISDKKIDKKWNVVFIENKYLKVMVIPDLGGRIQMAYDKIKERHFVYYNHVIKPALVGLTGPWISGGIEFNWPQHHRPSTYDPVEYSIEENEDGSTTIWVSEVERMSRTKGMAGYTLHPDKAYIEIKVRLYNRTPQPQTFLWWANPAVPVNDHYQSVFPPDVHAVYDHGKRDVSKFPIATGEYYKMDYSAGVDISKYKNIPVPTSFMANTSKYDFVGGYDNKAEAGLLHVANHHVSPGKKQWTWGNGDFGLAWDRNLTDEDGPYIELMCGVYTDNQPDFSWLQPYEEKRFSQYFMPYQNVGLVKNATKDALLNLEVANEMASIKVHVTGTFNKSKLKLEGRGKVLFETELDLEPSVVCSQEVAIGQLSANDLSVSLMDDQGNILVSYTPDPATQEELPDPAKAARPPSEIKECEELYLQGLHLEQYRHATYDPIDYYSEALKRYPGDVRNNTALGLWYLKKGLLESSKKHFQRAIKTLTRHNPNPYDGEPYFHLGAVHKLEGDLDGAYANFYKACWNAAWQDAGYFNLAQIDSIRHDWENALEHINRSLSRNQGNHKALQLKVVILRKLNRSEESLILVEEALKHDRFNYGVLNEKWILTGQKADKDKLDEIMGGNDHTLMEYAIDYAQAGLFTEAMDLLAHHQTEYPSIYYLMGYYSEMQGEKVDASQYYQTATNCSPDYCFPNRVEEMQAIEAALKENPQDFRGYYYLGNYWYAKKQYELGLKCWEKSVDINPNSPIALRNLALAYFNKFNQPEKAVSCLERSFQLDAYSDRVLMELDQLYARLNRPVGARFNFLKANDTTVLMRDDLYLELVTLHNLTGEYEMALDLLLKRKFHPWEGGEGKVPYQYVTALSELAKGCIQKERFHQALEFLELAKTFPANFGEGKLPGDHQNNIYHLEGCAYEGLKMNSAAISSWKQATKGSDQPSLAMYYNDQVPDMLFYKGLAFAKLGDMYRSSETFNMLIDYGQKHMYEDVEIDYFAVSLPNLMIWDDDLKKRNQINCHYLIGLGQLGKGSAKEATSNFEHVLKMDSYHMGAQIHLMMAKESTQNNKIVSP
ncbi:DUF5107 domain-containing protein [Marinoscillum sp.]|uniref:DUF5107 domain-containing protein n=1 Tax=Marinoscillum sp. TaxID=2024838 RepID=UPI003BA91264